jgi:hypothetical protein
LPWAAHSPTRAAKDGSAGGGEHLGRHITILSDCRSFPLQSASEEVKNNAKICGMVQFRADSGNELSIVN